jgi:hypothetical protein
MAGTSLIDRIVSTLFGKSDVKGEAEQQLVSELIETIVDTVEPRVRAHGRYQQKLEGPLRSTIAYLRAVGKLPAEPLLLTRANWNEDPRLNAFFARADDVPAFLGRSKELRAFFESPANAAIEEAYALLGMKKDEKTIFAPRLEDGMLKQDVAQTSVSFSEHRLIAPSASEQETRLEVGRRIVLRLAQLALARIIALDEKAVDLQQQKGYLGTRLRMLNLARDGMEGIVDDPTTIAQQIRTVERELKETVEGYIETKSSLATLDGYIAQIDEVFSHPEKHVTLTQTDLRVSRMGIKVDERTDESHHALTLAELNVGDKVRGVIALVRCPRAELPPKEDLIANAERYL